MGRGLRNSLVLVPLLAVIWSGSAKAAPAVKAEDFYKGATVIFVVPSAPGGSFDIWARTLLPYLNKYTGATVVVNNMAGAGGLTGGGYLYNAAKPDGLTIGIIQFSAMVSAEMLGFAPVKYEMAKFNYLGRLELTRNMLFASAASGFKTIQDMQKSKKKIRFGVPDPVSITGILQSILIEAFGLNGTIASGYSGVKEMKLALIAGRELDAKTSTVDSTDTDPIKAGQVSLIASLAKTRHPLFPDIPTALETPGLSEQGKKLVTLGATLQENVYVIVAPPGTPEDRVAFLEKALAASLKEPAIIEWTAKQAIALSYLPGQQVKASVHDLGNLMPPAERSALKHILLEKYY